MSRQKIKEALIFLHHMVTPLFNLRAITRGQFVGPVELVDEVMEIELVTRIAKAYRSACEDGKSETKPYQAGGYWGSYSEGVAHFKKAALDDDVHGLRDLLREFLRGPSCEGMYGYKMLKGWTPAVVNNINLWLHDADIYTNRGGFSLDHCAGAPMHGNPNTFIKDGHHILWSAPNHKFQAGIVRELVKDTPNPIVLEIGGGFG